MNPNAWDTIGQSYIEGALLQCRKGEWSLDGLPVKTGQGGVRLVLLMSSAEVGEIAFDEDGQKIGEHIGLIENGFIPAKEIEPSWSPSTKVVCVGFSGDIRGQTITFRSSSWGGRYAFMTLAGTFRRFQQTQFPVVSLEVTKKTRSGNVVIDPLFVVDHWLPRKGFETPGALPEPPQPHRLTQAAQARYSGEAKAQTGKVSLHALEATPPSANDSDAGSTGVIDDDIPF